MAKAETETTRARLLDRFIRWAQARKDLRAAVLVGSQARADHPADEWSDLDILIVTTEPENYLSSTEWLNNFGPPRITFLEKTAVGDEVERRVLYDDGTDVDFAIIPSKSLQKVDPEFALVASRGMRILVDKDNIISNLAKQLPTNISPAEAPPESEFLSAVNDFWYHAVWTAKKLRRGELWTAKACCDSYMKGILLRLIEAHARLTRGLAYDTWHSGRFLEEWAEPRVLERLKLCFARYEESDVKNVLIETMNLFRWLAKETASRLQYQYPTTSDEYATQLVQAILSKSRTDSNTAG